MNKSLYEDKHPTTSTKGTGFKNKQKALDTLKIIKKTSCKHCIIELNIIHIKQKQ